MDEATFWLLLESRVSGEMVQNAACRELGMWCDGFVPERREAQRCRGQVWIGQGGAAGPQALWTFELLLGDEAAVDATEPDWAKLMPADDATAWLAVDVARRHLVVAPLDAVAAAQVGAADFALQSLIDQTAMALVRTPDRDGVQAVVVQHLERACAAKLTLREAAQALGDAAARANLALDLEGHAFELLERLGTPLAQRGGAS